MRWTAHLGGHVNTVLGAAQRLVVSHLGGLWPWLSGRLRSTASGPTAFRQTNQTILFADLTETVSFRDRSERRTYSART